MRKKKLVHSLSGENRQQERSERRKTKKKYPLTHCDHMATPFRLLFFRQFSVRYIPNRTKVRKHTKNVQCALLHGRVHSSGNSPVGKKKSLNCLPSPRRCWIPVRSQNKVRQEKISQEFKSQRTAHSLRILFLHFICIKLSRSRICAAVSALHHCIHRAAKQLWRWVFFLTSVNALVSAM